MTITEALDELQNILTSYYEGREELRDVVQLRVLSVFLQTYGYKISEKINELYISLGKIISEYNMKFYAEREKLKEEYNIDAIVEKKIENMILQNNNEVLSLLNEKNVIINKIKGLENEQKFLGYLNQSLNHLISKVSNEWKYGQGNS